MSWLDVTEISSSDFQEEQARWKQRSEIDIGSKADQKHGRENKVKE